jgi:hypothetical protein
MSQQNAAQKQSAPEQKPDMAELQRQVTGLRGLVADMAFLFLPPVLRHKCECGKISCRKVTAVKPGVAEAKDFILCEDCKSPADWTTVAAIELGPVERETVRLANKLIIVEPKA